MQFPNIEPPEITPVPLWLKLGAAATLVILIAAMLWIFSGRDPEPAASMADIEASGPVPESKTPNKPAQPPTQSAQANDIPVQPVDTNPILPLSVGDPLPDATPQTTQSLPVPDPDLDLPLVHDDAIKPKASTPPKPLAQLQARLTQTEHALDDRQQQVEQTLTDLQQRIAAQALQIEQLQSGLEALNKARQRRRVVHRRPAKPVPPPPFTLVSIDQWGHDVYAIVRANGKLAELMPGQTFDGWRFDAIDRQAGTVTLTSAAGAHRKLLMNN